MNTSAKTGDFSSGKVWKQVVNLALPLTMAEIVQLLYNIVDRIYLGHLPGGDSLPLTGVGLVLPVISLIGAFTSLFGQGGTPLFSMARGAKNEERASLLEGCVFVSLLSCSLILMALLYALHVPLLYAFGASERSFPYARDYLLIYLIGTPFIMLSTGLNGFINAQGFPRVGMMTTIFGAALNLLLDPLFLFVLNLGVRGAALATVLSQALSCAWVLLFLTGKKALLPLRFRYMRMQLRMLREIVSLGVVGFIMKATNFLVQMTANTTLQQYGGDVYVSVMTVANSVREILTLPATGVTSGSQPVTGYNYGAKQYGRVRESIRFTSLTAIGYTLIAWLLVLAAARPLAGLFTSDPETLRLAPRILRLYFMGFVFQAFQLSAQTTFQALGDTRHAIFFSLLRKVVIVFPLTLLLPRMGLGTDGVFLAEPISNLLGGMAAFVTMYLTVYRKLQADPRP